MAQTSNTEAVAIPPLKHLYGVPLGTTTTLVGLRVGQHAPTPTRAHDPQVRRRVPPRGYR